MREGKRAVQMKVERKERWGREAENMATGTHEVGGALFRYIDQPVLAGLSGNTVLPLAGPNSVEFQIP